MDKLAETIAGTSTRAIGAGDLAVKSTAREAATIARTYEGRSGAARSEQGFVAAGDPTLASCFVLCADKRGPPRCANQVATTTTSRSFVPAPTPGAALRALSFLVHHPTETAWGGAALLTTLAALAIATRKRPKRRRLR